MTVIAIALVLFIIICGFLGRDKKPQETEPQPAEFKPMPNIKVVRVGEETDETPKPKDEPKARKRNLKYFHKSESGNIYPAEYWHMNNYIDFKVAGVNYRGDLSAYVGEFIGRLVADPENEYDPNAIRVEHQDGRHIGFVPKDKTKEVRNFKQLPCDCYCYIERRKDDDGNSYFLAWCYVTEHPFGE